MRGKNKRDETEVLNWFRIEGMAGLGIFYIEQNNNSPYVLILVVLGTHSKFISLSIYQFSVIQSHLAHARTTEIVSFCTMCVMTFVFIQLLFLFLSCYNYKVSICL